MVEKPKVAVIGSANIDLVTQTSIYPQLGETIFGKKFHQFPGGKGANQAVAAARLGAHVTFIGCIGNDQYGKQLIENFKNEDINVDHIIVKEDTETGLANIIVTEKDNMIIFIPGANYRLSAENISSMKNIIHTSDIIVLQLEIPLEAVAVAIDIAYEGNVPVILNPAPAMKLPYELLNKVTYITPNESEMAILASSGEKDNLERSFKNLFSQGANQVILTRGKDGVIYGKQDSPSLNYFKSYNVDNIDTTGAGDTFNAAFSVAVARGMTTSKAIDFANMAAALSITKLGAQSGMPTKTELEDFISKNNGGY